MKIELNIKYLCVFFIILAIEVMIAIFAKNHFIRDYFGDILVVILIHCFIKSFVRNDIKLLPMYIFIFAILTEFGQYFHLVDLLGLGEYTFAKVILGTAFDIRDIICYFIGCMGIWIFEKIIDLTH